MLVTPFLDPNAHGALGKSIIFTRRRGIIYAKPYKVPKDPKSVDQIAQRQAFKDAVIAYKSLHSITRKYFDDLAIGQSYTGLNLYCEKYLLDTLPSTVDFEIMEATALWLNMTHSTIPQGWAVDVRKKDVSASYGYVFDNTNINVLSGSLPPKHAIAVEVVKWYEDIIINKGDTLLLSWKSSGGASGDLLIYMPAMTTNTYLYVSDDGSTWYDAGKSQLACAPGY